MENFEQKYNKALEKARELMKTDTVWDATDLCQKIFSELNAEPAESQDEKIIKTLKEVINTQFIGTTQVFGIEKQEIYAWLEKQKPAKQGHKVPVKEETGVLKKLLDEETPHIFTDEERVVETISFLNKENEPKFKVGDKIQYLKGCGTIMTIEKIENGEYIFGNNKGCITIESGNKWHLVEQNHTDRIKHKFKVGKENMPTELSKEDERLRICQNMNQVEEISGYITRMVPDIARKCGCKDCDVWDEMYYLSKIKTQAT